MIQIFREYRLRIYRPTIQLTIVIWIMLYRDLGEFVGVLSEPTGIEYVGKFEAYSITADGRTDKDVGTR